MIGAGVPSTNSLASFNPNPVISRTTLITPIFLAPAFVKITSTSDGPAAASAPPTTATGAAAVTPNSSSITLSD